MQNHFIVSGSALRCCSLHASGRHHRAVPQRLRSDGYDAESLVRSSEASLRESRHHNAGHGRHLAGQEECDEQSVEAAAHRKDELPDVKSGRSSERDRANLRVGENVATRRPRLRHDQSPVTVDQDFAQSNPRLPANLLTQSVTTPHQVSGEVSKSKYERSNGGR